MKKWLILYIIFFVSSFIVHGQDLKYKDSLLKLLPKAKNDTNAVFLYLNVGELYESSQPELAKAYYRQAQKLSQKIHYNRGLVKFCNYYTFVLNIQDQLDSSVLLNLEAVKIAKNMGDSVLLAKTLFNLGTSYTCLADYENAVKSYEQGKKILERFKNDGLEGQACDILQNLYSKMRNFTKATELAEKSVSIFRHLNAPKWLLGSLTNLGVNYSAVGNINKAKPLFEEALTIAISIGDKNAQTSLNLNLGDYMMKKGDYEEMKPYAMKALALAREIQLHESEAIALNGLSLYYIYKKDFGQAQQLSKDALEITYHYHLRYERVKIFAHLSKLAYAMQQVQLGEQYVFMGDQLNDSLINETIRKSTLNLEKKYETEKKEARIHHLLAEEQIQTLSNQRKKILIYILIGGFLTLVIIIMLLYRNYKQKQKIQQQRISELETEKQLEATEAVMKGEDQERTRIAKDLHDGLGGMLSGIKYSFITMKENLIMTPDNHQAFERSLDMLDSSIKEMRRVAHNMMPEALVRFGLDTALKDFCNDINQSGALKVNYQSIGMEGIVLEETTSITLYRVVQELLNNTMKHANAKSAIVQLTRLNRQLSVTVEDDGKGFDTNMLKVNKGIGWANIQNRVEFLKGKLDITSKACEGTSVQIELNL